MTTTSPNGVVPPGDWMAHIGHAFHPHRHVTVGKEPRRCSGRWWCEKDKTWIDGPKCGEKP